MTNLPAPVGHAQLLTFQKHSIRYLMLDGVPWFPAEDICAAAGLYPNDAKVPERSNFPDYAKRICSEETDDGLQDAILLSPVGVWLLTTRTDPYKGQSIAAWAKKEALRLCANPQVNDPALYLTLNADGDVPPAPKRFSGRYSEWLDLKDSPEHHAFKFGPKPGPTRQSLQAALLAAAQGTSPTNEKPA